MIQKLPSRERMEAHAGAALSLACVKLPHLIGRYYIGEPNSDGTLVPKAYPLTPLRWRVAKTLASDISHFAEYPGDPDAAGKRPKDFPTAAISTVALEHLRPHPGEALYHRPAVGWTYGNQLLVSPIPEDELGDVEGETFSFATRRGEQMHRATAGLWLPDEGVLWTRGEITAGDIVPVTELPEHVVAY